MYMLSKLIVFLLPGPTNGRPRPTGKCSELESSSKDYRPENKGTVLFRLTNDSLTCKLYLTNSNYTNTLKANN